MPLATCNHAAQNTNEIRTGDPQKYNSKIFNLCHLRTFAKFIYLKIYIVCDMLIVCQSVNTVQLVHVTSPVKIIGQKPDIILVVS